MLRINLLPSYVPQRRLTRKLTLIFSALFFLCVAVPLFLYLQAAQQKSYWSEQATTAEAGKAKTDQLRQQAQTTRAQIAPILAKVKFVQDVHQHNTDIVNFWDTVSKYSDPRVVYSDAAVSGPTLTIKAYSPSIAEIGRYLQAMYQEPDFQTVGIDKLPGYPEAVVSKYYLGNQLIAVGASNASSGSGGQSTYNNGSPGGQAGGRSGTGGRPWGTPANIGPAGTGTSVPVLGTAGGGQANSPGGQGAQGQSDTQKLFQVLLATHRNSVVLNPFAPPQSQYKAIATLVKRIKVRREPQGFPVTVTATLKMPLTIPQVPGAPGTATGAPGGFPGASGPPGGYPGAGGPPGYPGTPRPVGPPRGA